MTKYIISLVLAVVITGAIYGAYQYPQIPTSFGNAASASGSTFTTSKIAFTSWYPSTNAATSTSLYNGDATDRIVSGVDYWCSSLTAVNYPLTSTGWLFNAATTTTNSLGLQGNTNYILGTTVATTTSELWVSSTTPGLTTTADFRRWPAGTYMTFNANASTTANCTIGVSYRAT